MAVVNRGGEWTKYYAAQRVMWLQERAALAGKVYPRIAITRPYQQSDIDFDAAAAWKPAIVRKVAA